MIPGEIIFAEGPIELNAGLDAITLRVKNTGDRPIQVGAHYHFFEVNPILSFDREPTYGRRLDIAAGTSVRFEPGQAQTVRLVPYRGARELSGFRGYVDGRLDDPAVREAAFRKMREKYNPGQDVPKKAGE